MLQISSNTLGEHPVLRGQFPLRWETQATQLTELEQHAVNTANEATLRSYYLLDERLHDNREDREEAAPEIARLEQRLNLIVDLLGQVLQNNLDLPPPTACVLSRAGAEWISTAAPTLDAAVKLWIYLQPHYPKPLVLYGVVSALDACALGQQITVRWPLLADPVADGLERLIFRAHRRSVAESKRGHNRQPKTAQFGAKKVSKL